MTRYLRTADLPAIARATIWRPRRRRKFFRVVRAELECGHTSDLNTSRYRVTADLAAIIFGELVRRGCWCFECGATCQPVRMLGVFRA